MFCVWKSKHFWVCIFVKFYVLKYVRVLIFKNQWNETYQNIFWTSGYVLSSFTPSGRICTFSKFIFVAFLLHSWLTVLHLFHVFFVFRNFSCRFMFQILLFLYCYRHYDYTIYEEVYWFSQTMFSHPKSSGLDPQL